jgi:asparagine synthase (glutamine-hydrolysing)
MCGIAGILNSRFEPVARSVLQRMTTALAHRGPDGEDVFARGPVGLGHRRLAIIDLSAAARQPMQSSDGRFVLSYNGEIYNFREVRRELEALGYVFQSHSDTEVLLKGFAAWGIKVVHRLNGMFAFAIWDQAESTLWLARDRYGIKPLYYTFVGGSLLFASEIKSFLAHPDFRVVADKAAVVEYFTFQNFFTDRTLFAGVRLLPAGHWLHARADSPTKPELQRYWDYAFEEPEPGGDDAELVEEFDRLFVQAVKRHLVSDVPVSAYLSGGIDSGSITAVAARQLPYLHSFTVGFDLHSASGLELAFDEREKAERMSYLFKTEHYQMVLKAGDMERAMSRLVWHMEEPRVGQSYPNYYAAQLASKFAKVVLAGTGGDELFGGYPWRYYRAVVNHDFENYIDKYYGYWQRLVPTSAVSKLFSPLGAEARAVDTRAIFRGVFASHADKLTRPEDYINHSLYFEARTFLHGLLVVDDKLGMAHGLETRVPFLDNDLVDFAMRLPVRTKLGNLGEVMRLNENEPGDKTAKYFDRTRDGKLILRRAMARHVPPDVTAAVKQGFSAPDASWFKGESIDFVRRALMRPDAAIYEYLDRATVQALVNDHLEGRENRRLLIWSLLSFEHWCRIFVQGQALDADIAAAMPMRAAVAD